MHILHLTFSTHYLCYLIDTHPVMENIIFLKQNLHALAQHVVCINWSPNLCHDIHMMVLVSFQPNIHLVTVVSQKLQLLN